MVASRRLSSFSDMMPNRSIGKQIKTVKEYTKCVGLEVYHQKLVQSQELDSIYMKLKVNKRIVQASGLPMAFCLSSFYELTKMSNDLSENQR